MSGPVVSIKSLEGGEMRYARSADSPNGAVATREPSVGFAAMAANISARSGGKIGKLRCTIQILGRGTLFRQADAALRASTVAD